MSKSFAHMSFFKHSPSIVMATPYALSRKKRNKQRTIIATSVIACSMLALILYQWRPSEQETTVSLETAGQAQRSNHSLRDFLSKPFQGKPLKEKLVLALNIDKNFLRKALSKHIKAGVYPAQLLFNDQALTINYTIDQDLQDWATARLKRYNPDYGVFVALEPDSGKLLALATSRRDQQQSADLALRATYPAASTFKVITAAAMFEEGLAKPDTMFAFNGKSTSLYKRQVYQTEENKWTRRMSLKTAFAKSANPIFGRLGAKKLGAQTLLEYAERFGYNAQFISDFDFDNGSIKIDLDDEWQAAEAASGYTRRNTLSPIHGAVIAATIANGGKLISPSIVERVTDSQQKVLYSADQAATLPVLSDQSVHSMQKLMRATISHGTGRKSFRSFSRNNKNLILGGKSGHLSGNFPKGTYDWFIGYGQRKNRKIAYAMLCINKEKWYVKSSRFAREVMEHYFKQSTKKVTTAINPPPPLDKPS